MNSARDGKKQKVPDVVLLARSSLVCLLPPPSSPRCRLRRSCRMSLGPPPLFCCRRQCTSTPWKVPRHRQHHHHCTANTLPSLAWTPTTTTVLAAVVADTHAHNHLLDVFLARMSMETAPSDTPAAVIAPPSSVAGAHFASSSKQLQDSHPQGPTQGPRDLATQASWHRMHPAEFSLRPYPSNSVFCLRLLLSAATPAEGRRSSQGSKTRRQRRHETDKEKPASERWARFLAGLACPN